MRRKSARYSVTASQSQSEIVRMDRFPMLPEEEIIDALEKYNIMMDSRTLSRPNEQIVRSVFISLLHLSEIDTDISIDPSDFDGQEHRIQFLEFNLLLVHLQKLFRACKIDDFNLMDIVKPNPEDFKRQLCAWINFKRFVNNRTDKLRPILERNKELHAKGQEWSATVDDKREKKERLYKGDTSYSSLVRSRNKTQRKLKDTLACLEQKKALLEDIHARESQTKVSLESLTNEAEEIGEISNKLSREVVPSPERLKQDKAAIESKIEEHTKYLSELKINIAETESNWKHNEEELSKMNRLNNALNDYMGTVNEIEERAKNLRDLRNRKVELEAQAREIENTKEIQQERYEIMVRHGKKEVKRATHELANYEERKKALSARTKDIMSKMQQASVDLSTLKTRADALSEERKKIEKLVEDKENLYYKNSATLVNTLTQAYQQLTNELNFNTLKQ